MGFLPSPLPSMISTSSYGPAVPLKNHSYPSALKLLCLLIAEVEEKRAHPQNPASFSECMRSAGLLAGMGENMTKDEARRDRSPLGSLYSRHAAIWNPKLGALCSQQRADCREILLCLLGPGV